MSEPANPVSAAEAEAFDYLRTWAESMTQVLGQIAAAPFRVECAPSAPPEALPPAESDLHLIVVAGGALRGEMSLRLPQDVVIALAQIFLGETKDPTAEIKADHREAVVELLRQVAGHAATAAKPQWGEIQLRVEAGTLPSWAAGAAGWMASASDAPVRLWLEWQLSAALVAELRPARERASAPPPAEAHASQPDSSPVLPPEEDVSEFAVKGKIDLFMDVELDVSLRFGGRRMFLREVLQLGPGSVVELDRQVQEPADLLLDGKLIARGEVVVVDGNYGLRVLEVVSSQLPN